MSALPQSSQQRVFKVEVSKGPHVGAVFSFDKATVTIGRGPENDIVLLNDLRVSRRHAEIKWVDEDYAIVNLSQKNYVLVNGQRVQSEPLGSEATIVIGETEMIFRFERPVAVVVKPSAPAPQPSTPAPAMNNHLKVVPNTTASAVPYTHASVPSASPPMGVAPRVGAVPTPVSSIPRPTGNPGFIPSPPSYPKTSGGSSRLRFYVIVGVILAAGWFLLSSNDKAKDTNAIRTGEQIALDLQNSEKLIEQLESRKKQMNEVQYSRAQENFIKGFRDFQQGQYARARESFQVVLNLDPDNVLAKRYLQLAKIKFDEMVKFSMIQGARYREKKNWRMCQSSFFHVMTMLHNRKDEPTYQEAKRYYDECSLNMEGRF